MLMHTNRTTTGKVLASLGIPMTACGRFFIMGCMWRQRCMVLSHDDHKLTTAQVSQVKDILMESLKKILDKTEQS